MNFAYYICFFHDGSLNAMRHIAKRAEFELNSAELGEDDNLEHVLLNKDHRIVGTLMLEGIRRVSINNSQFEGQHAFPYDDAEVLDFDIRGNEVMFGIQWRDFPPKPRTSDWWALEIEADEIVWEDALNPVRMKLNGLHTDRLVADWDKQGQ